MLESLRRRLQKLSRPGTWIALAKLGVVLGCELIASPAVLLLSARAADPERILELQNRFRRAALRWMHPDVFDPPRNGQ